VRACVPDLLGFCDSGLVYDEGVGSARRILSAVVNVWEGPGGRLRRVRSESAATRRNCQETGCLCSSSVARQPKTYRAVLTPLVRFELANSRNHLPKPISLEIRPSRREQEEAILTAGCHGSNVHILSTAAV
jgi:hypothetical protein